MDRAPTETSSPRGNVPRGINRARLQKKRRRPLCARIRDRPGSKIISSGTSAFPIHPLPFPGFTLGATDEKPSLLSRTSPHRSLSLRRGLRARIAIRRQQVRRRQYCVEGSSFFNFNRRPFFSILQARKCIKIIVSPSFSFLYTLILHTYTYLFIYYVRKRSRNS